MPRTLLGQMACGLVLVATSCGGGDERSAETVVTSHEALCAGAAPEYAGGYATAISCPFEQHVENFLKFGHELAAVSPAFDAAGAHVADVSNTCETWALGVDLNGVTVIIEQSSGKVISHGAVHAGQPKTLLPPSVAAPVAMRQ